MDLFDREIDSVRKKEKSKKNLLVSIFREEEKRQRLNTCVV